MSAEGGFTLIEALVALFILSIVSLSMAQMIGMGLMVDANSEHLTSATTLSVNKLEELRNSDYASLTAGGDHRSGRRQINPGTCHRQARHRRS